MHSVASPAFDNEDDDDDKPIAYDDLDNENMSTHSRKRLMSAKSQQLLRLPGSFKPLDEPVSSTSPFTVSSLPFSSKQRSTGKDNESQAERMQRQRSQGSLGTELSGPPQRPKDTFLLTNSPVPRIRDLPEERETRLRQDSASTYPPEPPYSPGPSYREGDVFADVPIREKGGARDVKSATDPPMVLSPNRREDFDRGLHPSASISTTQTARSARRRLPSPPSPQNIPAPAYYPPGGAPLDEPLTDVKVASPEGILSPVYSAGSGFSPTLSHPLSADGTSGPQRAMTAPRPPYAREASDVVVADPRRTERRGTTTATAGDEGSAQARKPRRVKTEDESSRRPARTRTRSGPLTAANVTRLNDESTRESQLNPLIRTFNSPIGERDISSLESELELTIV